MSLSCPTLSLHELAAQIGGELILSDATCPTTVSKISDLKSAQLDAIAFLVDERYLEDLKISKATCVILPEKIYSQLSTDCKNHHHWLLHDNPYVAYAKTSQIFHPLPSSVTHSIHPSSIIATDVKLGQSVTIGPFVVIESGCEIGDGVTIQSQCFVGKDCVIGSGTTLYANVTVYEGSQIGQHVIIHAGAVIGSDGFGFAPDFSGASASGSWLKIAQIGKVIIGDDVEIGASSTIDRGALEDTIIGAGCKIDNQVQIGHNVQIGRCTVIAGCTGIAGSTQIGSYCIIGGGVGIAGHLLICDKVTITGGSGVAQSISEPGTYSSTKSIEPYKQWQRNTIASRDLYQMRQQLKKLNALKETSS